MKSSWENKSIQLISESKKLDLPPDARNHLIPFHLKLNWLVNSQQVIN